MQARSAFSLPAAVAMLALAPLVAAQESVKLAEVPAGIRIGRDVIPTSNAGAFIRRSAIAWSTDGTQVAYAGIRGSESMPVVGSRVGASYHSVSRPQLVGGRVFFHVVTQATPSEQKHWVWVDGKTLPVEDWIGKISASPGGERVAYWTHPGAKTGNTVKATSTKHYFAVATRRKSGTWRVSRGDTYFSPAWRAPLWSADGKRVFTCGLTRKGWAVLDVGRRQKVATEERGPIASIAVSETGSALAFVRTDQGGGQPELYFKGRRVGEGHRVVGRPAVDAAGKRVAYAVATKGGATVAVGDEKTPAGAFGHVLEIAFAPRSDRLAFVAVADGSESASEPGLIEGGAWSVVVRPTDRTDGLVEHAEYVEVRDLVWNEEGTRLAYAARDPEGWRIVCGDRRSEVYDDVGRPHFLPGGAALGHGARVGRELWWKVLDE